MASSNNLPLLIVEDDLTVLDVTKDLLRHNGWKDVSTAASGQQALDQVEKQSFSVILLDLGLPDLPADIVFTRLKERRPETPIVIVTAKNDLDAAVRYMRDGAFDYVVKGGEPIRLVSAIEKAFQHHRRSTDLSALQESILSSGLKNPQAFAELITVSERVKNVLRMAEAVSPSDEAVLITGETGVGKELLAHAIHRASGRSGDFVAFNVAALEDPVFDDTLFGHLKGAFTGADQARKGLAAAAEGGTLFLDEVGDLKPQSQVKLLRFLESHEYFPLGSDTARRSSARLIAATNCDLNLHVERGSFRRDLLYRLSTFQLALPPLRERAEDIPPLCEWLLKGMSRRGEETPRVSADAMEVLVSLGYPGNVRELRQVLLRAKVVSGAGIIGRAVLESLGHRRGGGGNGSAGGIVFPEKLPTIRETVDALVREAIRRSGGKQNAAGALIGISPQAMSKRIRNNKSPSNGWSDATEKDDA